MYEITLLNTAVATKEMVHWIFKGMVPHTNLKRACCKLFITFWMVGQMINLVKVLVGLGIYQVGQLLKQWFILEDPIIIVTDNEVTVEDSGRAI